MSFEERYRKAMKKKGMNFVSLSKEIHRITNVACKNTSSSYLQKYSCGLSPTIRIVKIIAKALDVDASYLAYGGGIYSDTIVLVKSFIDSVNEIDDFSGCTEKCRIDIINYLSEIKSMIDF